MQEYVIKIVPLEGDAPINDRFAAASVGEAVFLLNKLLDQFQVTCLRKHYQDKTHTSFHPTLGHDVTMEPFVNLHKYHRHTDGVVYLTYREFEPVYGDDNSVSRIPVIIRSSLGR